ncbi:MAG: preprotein translocase subunit SecE [Saprospiraceae bacterium]|jgi:preprotein translocase subunit SecE|uniref:Protein translocase subunit SecE n=1 Tax=Candidatus Defluviibacterium haderslevense TaxID=2981993 RepID=A0A9D7XGN3_9BACT|nr:preprotein translocase subunit SecE [Candidatus Defluviibacterium haderslevense]MCC7028329.1 preprotein translocase subunit SecE [Saprospiraceae bacterium]MBK7244547.1 preprotein translocase subunit SecE [Candidatus Defluviibacterium haderslevense]MBK8244714.1 preprotein translocase subunit SecE [Candidatus Defluviibacterium haderslevense]MBK9719906.1 preprotein translocase subunit SecE [Candidatus Defluviibacterium haderslevense]
MDKFLLYLKESYSELLEKVTWPTWPNLLDSARVVIIASVIIALVILAMDLIANTALGFIYNL